MENFFLTFELFLQLHFPALYMMLLTGTEDEARREKITVNRCIGYLSILIFVLSSQWYYFEFLEKYSVAKNAFSIWDSQDETTGWSEAPFLKEDKSNEIFPIESWWRHHLLQKTKSKTYFHIWFLSVLDSKMIK